MNGCTLQEVYATSNENILKWQSYSNIPICKNFSLDFPPNELFQSTCEDDFMWSLYVWPGVSFEDQGEWQPNSPWVRVRFINSTFYFPDPNEASAGTWHAINDFGTGTNYIVGQNIWNVCEELRDNWILLNNTDGRQWYWTHNTYIQYDDIINFRYAFTHELGHEIGLAHCVFSSAIMHATPPAAPYFVNYIPQQPDIDGLNIILGISVGIEDWIEIILEATHFNVNQIYVSYNSAIFHDEWPYGDYIVEWGPWKIEALHPCGKVLVFETEGSSYINIPALPDGYLWQRDESDNVLAVISTSGIDNDGHTHYASVPITIGNVPNDFITSGWLTSNTTWRGCVLISGTIQVPSGITLTIYPDAHIIFQNNASLIVQGTLSATNCLLSGGLENWGPIYFYNPTSSNSVLDNVVVENSGGIRCYSGANVTISNSKIDHCTEGIYFYNSAPSIISNQIIEPVQNGINGNASGLNIEMLHNTITKTSGNPQYKQYQGIILGNSTNGFIAHNDISGFAWGIYVGGGSDAFFKGFSFQPFNPNNRFKDHSIGIGAGWGGYIFAGYGPIEARFNSIYDNSVYDAKSYNNSDIYAQYNWWGTDGAQTYVDGTSFLDASYPLSSDPWEEIQHEEDGMNILPITNNYPPEGDNFGPDSSIIIGINLEMQGRIAEAVLHYKQMVSNNNFPGFALRRLVSIKNRFQIHNIREYLVNLLNGNQSYKPIVMTLFAGILLGEDKYVQAMLLYSQIISQYPNTYYYVNALFEKFFGALNYERNITLAEQLLAELQSLGLTDEEYLMRLQIAENLFNEFNSGQFGKYAANEEQNTVTEIPKEYTLLGNYPNPFNPSTTISYSLPFRSSVDLVIYDIMGREVKSFNIASQNSGYQTVVWDGTNENGNPVASGVYLYRLNAKSLENDKSFLATSKLMLLK